jgi:serine/threonine-protein kinase
VLRDHQVRIICDVLEGLHHAHELADYDGRPLNVVHRDVSPHNIIITYGGDAKLVDFGIAKASDSTSQTRTGVIKGKLAYMSPEQAFGKPVDRRADIFAIGVILWEAITGRRMWKGNAEGAIAHRLSVGDIPKITEYVPEPPPLLKAICERALAPRSADRYPTAAAMRIDLEQYLSTLVQKPTARDLGALVAQAFGEERARLASLIEEQMRLVRVTTNPSELSGPMELPKINQAFPTLTPHANTPISKSGPREFHTGQMASSRTMQPQEHGGYPVKWLVLGGIALIILGAAATTAIMAPWSQGSGGTAPPPSSSAPDAH